MIVAPAKGRILRAALRIRCSPEMSPMDVQNILEQVKALSPEQQIELAEAVDRLTWSRRWRAVCGRIESRMAAGAEFENERIDGEVRAVRREKPLSERSSTHPS